MTEQELSEILDKHKKWIRSEPGGECANLDGANLDGANLNGANLDGANLNGASLYRANLYGANLYRASLNGANLYGANLDGASLYRASLYRASLNGASLDGANLNGANLYGANLNGASLYRANLNGANLDGANLDGANLDGASYNDKTTWPAFFVCPDTGSFTAWKKLQNDVIAELLIPADAKRTSSLVGRKCRSEFAIVVALHGRETHKVITEAHDKHTGKLLYKTGEAVRPDAYDGDFMKECTNGIHWFITRAEAEAY